MRHSRDPGGIELLRRGGRAPTGDAVRLLDERDAEPFFVRCLCGRDEVGCLDTAARTMAEHDRSARLVHGVEIRPRRSVWSLDLEHQSATVTSSPVVMVPPVRMSARRPPRCKLLEVRARLGEPPADAGHGSDAESVTDQGIQ